MRKGCDGALLKKERLSVSQREKVCYYTWGQLSLSVPAWHKDQSSTIVPPLNFSFWGKATGCA